MGSLLARHTADLNRLDAATLTPIVRRALRWFAVPATLRLLADPARAERTAGRLHRSVESLLRQRIPLVHFLLDQADEARRLARRHHLASD